MSFEPDPLQQLLLWRLAVSPTGGEFLQDIKPTIDLHRRKPLIREGLIEEDKRKSPQTNRSLKHLELTDKGWAWCQSHLGEEIKSPSRHSRVILERLLALMRDYLENQDQTVSLGQFIQQARSQSTHHPSRDGNGKEVEESIRRACLDLTDGRDNVRVRLAQLRSRLDSVPKAMLDEKLLEMERAGQLSLYRLDNPQEIMPEDRAAVLTTPSGHERHVLYWGGHSQ